jgi:hypothetical protein
MSFHLITIDTLMQLDIPTLTYALGLFKKELDGTIAFLHESEEAKADQQLLDDLQHLITLRKVFKNRLDELEAEEAAAATAAQEGNQSVPQLELVAA